MTWAHDHWIPFWCSNWLSYQAMSSSSTQNQLCTPTPVSSFVQCHISVATLFELNVSWGNHMSVAEWADTDGIQHWRILWSSYRKLAWVGLETITTEFCSDALIDWAIRPWVQVAVRAKIVQLLQFHRLISFTFHFGYCLRQSPCYLNIYMYI